MSSGLEPDDNPPSPSAGTSAYEQKLLAPAVRSQPGLEWSYASLPVDVLSLVAENVTGTKLGTFWQQEIGSKIGVASLSERIPTPRRMLRPPRAILPGSHTSCFSRASGTGPRS
jgi:CubicO group peptidase (beta-lactamase class C family)